MGGSRSQSRRLSLRAPLSPSPYIYIIPHFCGFVKRFSKKFATFLEKAFVQEKVQFLFTSCRLGFLHRPNLLTRTSCPLDTYIIPQFNVFVKSFLKKLDKNFVCGAARTHMIPLPTLPKAQTTKRRTRLERVEWHTRGNLRNQYTLFAFCTYIIP